MIAPTLVIAVVLLIQNASTSNVANSVALADSTLLTVFRFCRTGRMTIPEANIDENWLCAYRLLPTKESVDRIGRLLLESSASILRRRSEKEAESGSQNALTVFFTSIFSYCRRSEAGEDPQSFLLTVLRRSPNKHCSYRFLTKYMVFKAALYGGLDKSEAEMLKSVSFEVPMSWVHWVMFGRLVDKFANVECNEDLFAALASSCDGGVHSALLELSKKRPEIVTRLIEAYMRSKRADACLYLPDLFEYLSYENQYDLTKMLDPLIWDSKTRGWRDLYILSRFSGHPSEVIKNMCLEKRPKYLAYEGKAQEVDGSLLARWSRFDPRRVPTEIWIRILLYCANPLFQIYTVPMVCRRWRRMHYTLLSRSLTVQETFVKDLKSAPVMHKILEYRRYPWNYFLRSPQALITYSLLCLESTQHTVDRNIRQWMAATWSRFVRRISESGPQTPLASYLDLYVRCCRASESPLDFYQMPGMPSDQYAALISSLVSQYGVVPRISVMHIGDDFGRFVQILGDCKDLATLLLQDDPFSRDRLAVYLFLTRSWASSAVERILHKKSELHRFLTDENNSAGSCLIAIFRSSVECLDDGILAHSVVNFCLTKGPGYNSKMLKSVGDEIYKCCVCRFKEAYADEDETRDSLKGKLGLKIVSFLCKHCWDYTEEEFRMVEQTLEQCDLFSDASKAYAFKELISEH